MNKEHETDARRLNSRRAAEAAKRAERKRCTHCGRTEIDGPEEQPGSSARWYTCRWCGYHWIAPTSSRWTEKLSQKTSSSRSV